MKHTIAQIKNLLSMYDKDFFLTDEELLINISLELEEFQKEYMSSPHPKNEVLIDTLTWLTFGISALITYGYLMFY